METQVLSKNLFLFRFATIRDLENFLQSGPWSFDKNLLVLARVSGELQPSDLNTHYIVFWVRIYSPDVKVINYGKETGGHLRDLRGNGLEGSSHECYISQNKSDNETQTTYEQR